MARIWIGTSGWTYASWRGPFYPSGLAQKEWLAWYASRFATTEINGSFYRTPSLEAVARWRDATPEEFAFAWKASKFITHWKRLGPTSPSSLELMQTRLDVLGARLGSVLFQLPARFVLDLDRLRAFLAMLPGEQRYAFEFRHPSWFTEPVFRVLRAHGAALCISDHHDAPAPWIATAPFVYVRGHGPGGRYRDNYPDAVLHDWAARIESWRRRRRDVFVYFDNDHKSAAPHDAGRLLGLLPAAQTCARPPR